MDTKDSDRKGKTLGPRGGTETSHVRQSFSHGRSKSVTVEHKRKRVVVPKPGAAASGAAAPAEAASHAVFVVDAGRARQVPVQLGGRNGSMAWIRSGLQPGSQVIVYPPAAVREGVRVRARKV